MLPSRRTACVVLWWWACASVLCALRCEGTGYSGLQGDVPLFGINGAANCPCLPSPQGNTGDEVSYGFGECRRWDSNSTECRSHQQRGYCQEMWCYVDPSDCKRPFTRVVHWNKFAFKLSSVVRSGNASALNELVEESLEDMSQGADNQRRKAYSHATCGHTYGSSASALRHELQGQHVRIIYPSDDMWLLTTLPDGRRAGAAVRLFEAIRAEHQFTFEVQPTVAPTHREPNSINSRFIFPAH